MSQELNTPPNIRNAWILGIEFYIAVHKNDIPRYNQIIKEVDKMEEDSKTIKIVCDCKEKTPLIISKKQSSLMRDMECEKCGNLSMGL